MRITMNDKKFKVWMHTSPSPGSEYYDGYVDVYAQNEDQAVARARLRAAREGLHSGPMVIDKVERVWE